MINLAGLCCCLLRKLYLLSLFWVLGHCFGLEFLIIALLLISNQVVVEDLVGKGNLSPVF